MAKKVVDMQHIEQRLLGGDMVRDMVHRRGRWRRVKLAQRETG